MKQISVPVILILLLSMSACMSLMNSGSHELFRVNDAYYRPWVIRDLEKGIDVFVEFMDLDEEVEFTSLVLGGIEVDVTVSREGKSTVVRGRINTGPSLIENYEYEVTGAGDMINFRYRGADYVYPLKNLRREKTIYSE
ncbi:MAG: hypothetical protein KFF49_02840 [Bacteroidales bacterium]|nr:hypothetical protein [Bacteroidales bacterium]